MIEVISCMCVFVSVHAPGPCCMIVLLSHIFIFEIDNTMYVC